MGAGLPGWQVQIRQVKEKNILGIKPKSSIQAARIRAPRAGALAERIQDRKDVVQFTTDHGGYLAGRFQSGLIADRAANGMQVV